MAIYNCPLTAARRGTGTAKRGAVELFQYNYISLCWTHPQETTRSSTSPKIPALESNESTRTTSWNLGLFLVAFFAYTSGQTTGQGAQEVRSEHLSAVHQAMTKLLCPVLSEKRHRTSYWSKLGRTWRLQGQKSESFLIGWCPKHTRNHWGLPQTQSIELRQKAQLDSRTH